VPQEALLENLDAAIAALPADVELRLVDSSLPNTYVRDAMRSRSRADRVSFLSFREALSEATKQPPEGVWLDGGQLRLVVPGYGLELAEVGDRPAVYAFVLDAGSRRPMGRRVPCNDEGRDGDERAADGVWSCLIDIEPGDSPEIAILAPSLADRFPEMGGDLIALNAGVHLLQPGPPPSGSTRTLVIRQPNSCPWPDLVLLPDTIHPSSMGCEILAEAVLEAVLKTRVWGRFVE
jgi:hypothetical protein